MRYGIDNAKVLFIFSKEELKYSIQNAAYAQGDAARVHDKYGHDLLADDADHKMHQFKDVCEDGNWDRVIGLIGLALGEIEKEFLGKIYSPINDGYAVDNSVVDRSEYVIEINAHNYSFSTSMADYLMSLMKEYVVDVVLEDWAGLTFPEGQQYWAIRRQDIKGKIHEARTLCGKHHRIKPSII